MLTLTILALLAGGLMILATSAKHRARPEPRLIPIRVREDRRPRR
ncbi:hypothetical protein [Marinobacterium sedimentorum]|jgi:hypothetical protein|nr:hypothetical protein [Marinobacterium sedimentorum]